MSEEATGASGDADRTLAGAADGAADGLADGAVARRRGPRRATRGPTGTPLDQPVTDDPTLDDTDAGWGERVDDAAHQRWLTEQRPPHWG